ncbi:MAG: hypothetical protein ABIJ81_01835 [Patescibacteria group bacterium]
MRNWIKALRLPITLLAGLLSVVAFKLVGRINESFLPTLIVISVASATMMQNDLRDRFHDIKKGKVFTTKNYNNFWLITVLLWLFSLLLILYGWMYHGSSGLLPLLAVIVGLIYSETRRLPLVPIILVSLTSAAPALFPIFLGYSAPILWYLYIVTVLIIFSREMIKDIEDSLIDGGYKWTLPLYLDLGNHSSKWLLGAFLLVVSLVITSVYFQTIVIALFFIPTLALLLAGRSTKSIKRAMDVGILATLIFMLLEK